MESQELITLTASIADALGSDWFVPEQEDGNWARKIQHKALNATLYISGDGYNKPTKCTISGGLNVGPNGQYVEVYEHVKRNDYTHWEKANPGSISVTIARGAAVIAKEINRRFLPEYLRILALANAQVAKDEAYKSTKRANAIRLAVAAGSDFQPDPQDERVDFHVKLGYLSTDFHINGNSTVDIKVDDLTLAQAEVIIRFLRNQVITVQDEWTAAQ